MKWCWMVKSHYSKLSLPHLILLPAISKSHLLPGSWVCFVCRIYLLTWLLAWFKCLLQFQYILFAGLDKAAMRELRQGYVGSIVELTSRVEFRAHRGATHFLLTSPFKLYPLPSIYCSSELCFIVPPFILWYQPVSFTTGFLLTFVTDYLWLVATSTIVIKHQYRSLSGPIQTCFPDEDNQIAMCFM